MTNYRSIIWAILGTAAFMFGCEPELAEKYQRPDWLAGKVYTQLLENPDLSTFTRCVERTGYDTIIDVSGTYTVFAPTNEVFDQWLSAHNYNSVEDIPIDDLNSLVSYHMVQKPWTKLQLTSLDVYGWIDTLDVTNDKPGGFKRKTLLLEENKRYSVLKSRKETVISDEGNGFYRYAITDSRKYAPLFFSEYLKAFDLSVNDYEFYFERPWVQGEEIFYANARIISEQIPAENGFIYKIDQVVEPLKNAYELLAEDHATHRYSKFLDLLNQFPQFEFNEEETNEQPGAELGLQVDSLFDMSFPELAFDISSEQTKPPSNIAGLPEDVSIRYHHGIMAPTDKAFEQLINDYIDVPNGWGRLEVSPRHIKRIIANTHLSVNAVYPTDMNQGFYNGEKDFTFINQEDIIQKEYGSNCTFIGLNTPIVPRVFSSVVGPVYLQKGYSTTMYAIEASGLLAALKRQNKDYMLFFEDDLSLRKDSSLAYDAFNERFSVFLLEGPTFTEYRLSQKDLRNLLLNHVATQQATGLARKEFIPNLGGGYIVVNNETGEVSGTATTTAGYNGTEPAPNFPRVINANTDNGSGYLIDNWFSFSSATLYNVIQVNYPHFYNLLDQAGLVQKNLYRFNFLSESEFYTVLAPTAEAFQAMNAASLSKKELQQLLKLHFIQGELIFTDGRKNSGYYETTRVDERSTDLATAFTRIYIDPLTDQIQIKAADGSVYVAIPESESANVFAGKILVEENEQLVFNNVLINGVVHEIDKVLRVDELDRN